MKARRLRAFLDFLAAEYGGRVEAMRSEEPSLLRRKLLAVPGIGPETADSIALYAAGHPVFVVDAYTRRVFTRLGLLQGDETYAEVQRFFEDRLPRDADALQRLPRPGRPPRQGRLPHPPALPRVPPRRALPEECHSERVISPSREESAVLD